MTFGWMQYLIGIESLEKINGFLEIIHHLLLRGVVGVAIRFQRADTSPMLVPLVLPETLIVSLIVFPIGAHVAQ